MKPPNDSFIKKIASWKSRLQENELGFRLLIGLICWLCLFLFVHFREIKVETLELNTIANKYIVAQVDFEFPDEEATFVLRQEALSDLSEIYQLDDKSLKQTVYDLQNFLINDSSWRQQLPDISIEEVYKTLENFKSLLKEVRLTDASTRAKINKYQLSVKNYFIFSDKNKDKLTLPLEYWQSFKETMMTNFPETQKMVLAFVVNFFEKRTWPLEIDKKTRSKIKEYIENTVPQKFTEIKAGMKIVSQGEVVRVKHLAMMQAMKQTLNLKKNIWSPLVLIGNLLLSLIFIIVSAFYLNFDQKEVFRSLQKLSLLVCVFILTLTFSKIVEYVLLQSSNNLIDALQYPLIVPFAAILILILFNANLALFSIALISVILALTLAVTSSNFLIINLIASLIVIVNKKSLRKRKEVFEICGKSLFGTIPLILAFVCISQKFWSYSFVSDVGINILFVVIIAILVVGLLPVLESLFNVMTDITLMEYMDPSNELLKRLTFEMPGTYQHSLVLGNLAETAAQAIGANAMLCRVATLYHDIGKLQNTHFFTENQQLGVNIHQLLTPAESAQVIISHVKDGVLLAKKHRLPQSFIDIMQQHHGTMLVYYFYHKEIERQRGDSSKVDESKFRYPGPKPRSKESCIIMIADGVEAASRSLEDPSEEALFNMMDKVVKDRIDDGQFDECNLTFHELKTIKKILIQTLVVTRHVRVKYPEKKED